MKATEAALLVFLKKSDQFVIPIYQRTYSWGERECRQLWNDIVFAGKRQESGAHFVGSIVYIQDGIYQASTITPILVIDGQQRLTTVMLLLEALARYLEQHESLDVISPEDIRGDFLLNERKKGNDRFKLLLTQSDRETLCALVTQKDLPREPSIRMMANFQLFTDWISSMGSDLASLWRGLSRLILVDVSLDRDHDNPQLIFESMNSTGKELSQADLIRNFVLMGLEPALQTQLYGAS